MILLSAWFDQILTPARIWSVRDPKILALLAALRAKVMMGKEPDSRGRPLRIGQPRANFLNAFSVVKVARDSRISKGVFHEKAWFDTH